MARQARSAESARYPKTRVNAREASAVVVRGDVVSAVKARLAERLERLSEEVMAVQEESWRASEEEAVTARAEERMHGAMQDHIRLLGQLASGLADVAPEALPPEGAGFGSTVTVEDLDDGSREQYTVVTGQLIDVDAGQVSLASPIGQALLGRRVGETIVIQTPQRRRRMRLTGLRTIHERLDANGRIAREPRASSA